MRFLDEQHELSYNQMIQRDNTYPTDNERCAMFYILSGNKDLMSKINHIYDFQEHSIRPNCLDSKWVDLSSSSKSLVRLALNLYNNYTDEHTSPLNLLYHLDDRNYNLALNSFHIRFGVVEVVKEQDIEEIEEDDELEL
jgi:hypothetical protein